MQRLKELYLEYHRTIHPTFPESVRCFPTYFAQAKKTNGLTQCIIKYIELNGWQAERISSGGRYIDGTKTFVDSVGFTRTIGSKKYIKSTSTAGTADISAVINGLAVKIEVKNSKTKDKQSDIQKIYESVINSSNGLYYIARDLETFINWFDSQFTKHPKYKEIWVLKKQLKDNLKDKELQKQIKKDAKNGR